MRPPAADIQAAARRLAILVAVTAVLLMHGLTCMAGTAHLAGSAPHAASHMAMVTHLDMGSCPACHSTIESSVAGPLLTLAGDAPRSGHPFGHVAAVCAGLLLGLTLLSLLAAAAGATTRAPAATNPRWRGMRASPTDLLRPSLADLCVLRT